MELIDGAPLDRYLRDTEPGSAARARVVSSVVVQALGGLTALHARGVVHRDIKPQNILVRRDGRIVLSDFGFASLVQVVDVTGTDDVGMMLGTPRYMAPEATFGSAATAACDLYSLGATAFEGPHR